jgi:histidinol-phosphatase (PHP family)
MFDYHHHSERSVDSTIPMSDVCQTAIERGVTEVAFTEHMDFIPEERNTGYFDYEKYAVDVARVQDEFRGQVTVLSAIEVDYCPDFESAAARWLEDNAFDFVVGSVHYIRGDGNISEPRAADFFSGKSVEAAYGIYFDLVLQSARSGLWDSLGHLDLIKRFGVKAYGTLDVTLFRAKIEEILTAVIDSGMALEVNTSGLRQYPEDFYPNVDTLRLYHELGGRRLTVGSDSHNDRQTGEGICEAYVLLAQLGFDTVEQFRGRAGRSIPIESLCRTSSD